MERIFPKLKLFNECLEPLYPREFSSVLWTLFFNLYIDREPLDRIKLPFLCKVAEFSDTSDTKQFNDFLTGMQNENTKMAFAHLDQLFVNIDQLLYANVKISNKNFESVKMIVDNYQNSLKRFGRGLAPGNPRDYAVQGGPGASINFGDELMLDFWRLMNKVLGFGEILYFKRTAKLKDLANYAIQTLEINTDAPLLSLIVKKGRKLQQVKIQRKHETCLAKTCRIILKVPRFLQKDIVSQTRSWHRFLKRKTPTQELKLMDIGKGYINQSDEIKLSQNNTVMRNCFLLISQLETKLGFTSSANSYELPIKMKACECLNYILDIREDFLLSNFLTWYLNIRDENPAVVKEDFRALIESKIEKDIMTVLPNIMNTSSLNLGSAENYLLPEDFNFKKINPSISYIYDLDHLLINEPSDENVNLAKKDSIPVFPSLIYAFATSEDAKLQNYLMGIILRSFNQREKLLSN
jgi:hypothetical protein